MSAGFGSERRASDVPPHTLNRTMPGHGAPLIGYVSCHGHRKNAYFTRKDAKAVVKTMRRLKRDKEIEVYPCDLLEGKWHVGHPPRRRPDTPEEGS